MTIPLTGKPGGLFTGLGAAGKLLRDLTIYQGVSLPGDLQLLQQTFVAQQNLLPTFITALNAYIASTGSIAPSLQTFCQNVLNFYVATDVPNSTPTSLSGNLQILIGQMLANGNTVQRCTVTATNTPYTVNAGNGVCVTTATRGDGLLQENLFAEEVPIICTADAQTGGATIGQEAFTYRGEAATTSTFSPLWPQGSGKTTVWTATDPTLDASGGNLLTNSDFQDWVASVPQGWTVTVGPGQVSQSTTVFFSGISSLQIAGSATINTALTQKFGAVSASPPTGTTTTLAPNTVYLGNVYLAYDVLPAAGVLSIELIDQNGNVVSDSQGVANSTPITIANLFTYFLPVSFAFRLPRALPSTISIRLRISTPLSAGTNLFVGNLAMNQATVLYAGGPLASVFSSPTHFVLNDGFALRSTTDRGNQSYLGTFQTLFDRLFGMKQLGLLLPSSVSPTIPDSLINVTGGQFDFSKTVNSGLIPQA